MAQSNAERQRTHKERLRQKAAEGMALADLMLENQHALEGLITQIRQIVHQAGRQSGGTRATPWNTELAASGGRPSRQNERVSVVRRGRQHRARGFPLSWMSVQQWATMPRELLEVFGLTDVVAEWHRQPDETITGDNGRRPENAKVEEHFALATSPEGEEVYPLPETAEGSWVSPLEITFAKAPESLDFQSLHRAYLQWLDERCPHPARTVERRGWAQENPFPYDGTHWRYVGRPKELANSYWPLRYESEDGRTLAEFIEPEASNSAPIQIVTAKHSDHS